MHFHDKARWSRRSILSRFAVGAALAPFLPQLSTIAEAAGPGSIKRYVQWFWPLGTRPESFWPSGGESDFQMSEVLAPLQSLQGDLIVFKNIDHSGGVNEPHDPMPCFTCSYTENDLVGYGPAYNDPGVVAKGTSLDQYVAERWQGMAAFPILLFDICNNGGNNAGYHANSKLNYKGVPGEGSPYAAFDRLFAGFSAPPASGGGPDPALERIRNERRSVLDLVTSELKTLESTVLAAHDKDQLQRHLAGLRAMELRLQNPVMLGEGCRVPVLDANGRIDKLSYDNISMLGKLQMDIALASLACDFTRVVNIQWSRPGTDEPVPPHIGDNYHGVTHNAPDDQGMIKAIRETSTFFMGHLAYFAQQLKGMADGEGSVLDTTTIFANSEVGEPNEHTHRNVPYMILGGSAAYKTGRFLDYSSPVYANRLVVALCHAMGFSDVQRYGDTDKVDNFGVERGTGPIERFV